MEPARAHSLRLHLTHPVVVIVGPTASGKSDLAVRLALALDGEVVSADSMQIYVGMDIGTGKLPEHERLVPHFGLDVATPGQPYSASLFQDYARRCFKEIDERGHWPVLAGGTGFYVSAAIDDMDFPAGEQKDNPIREHYMQMAETLGPEALWKELEKHDPVSAHVIHPNNVRRVVRAFEMLAEGVHYADLKQNFRAIPQALDAIFIGIAVDPAVLNDRIERRVDTMLADGLEDEVKSLLREGFRDGLTAPQAIGYKELVAAIDGEITREEAIQAIKTSTRRYAKRQRSWFRRDDRITWLDGNRGIDEQLVRQALDAIEAHRT